jgi:hypothetical protein
VPEPKASDKGKTNGIKNGSKGSLTRPVGSTSSSASTTAPLATVVPAPSTGELNMDLDSFDKVMQAMDAELARKRGSTAPQTTAVSYKSKSKPKVKDKGREHSVKSLSTLPSEADLDDMSEDELLAMDRELRSALKGAGMEDDLGDEESLDVEGADMLEGDAKREYSMMRDFLESYRSQGGESGVIGNLFGRLGEK